MRIEGESVNRSQTNKSVSPRTVIKFLRYWWGAMAHGVISNAFGYGSVVATVILGILLTNSPYQLTTWETPIANAAIAILAVFTLYLFVGFYQAWNMMHPFKVDVVSGVLKTHYPMGQYDPQRCYTH